LLLQAAKRVKIALGVIPCTASFDQLRVESENLFASTAGSEVSLIGLGSFHLGLRSGGQAAEVPVIELQQELTLTNVVSFLHQ
jgi:hypothetical protein